MSVGDVLMGRVLDRILPLPFRYSLLPRGVMTGIPFWKFTFDYANNMPRSIILVEAIIKFTFRESDGWEPIAHTKHFIDHPHYGPNEKRDVRERSMGVKVQSGDIGFPSDRSDLANRPEAVHEVLSMTNRAEISLRVRVGEQIHQTSWYAYEGYNRQEFLERMKQSR